MMECYSQCRACGQTHVELHQITLLEFGHNSVIIRAQDRVSALGTNKKGFHEGAASDSSSSSDKVIFTPLQRYSHEEHLCQPPIPSPGAAARQPKL